MFDMATTMGSLQLDLMKSDHGSTPMSPSLHSPSDMLCNSDSQSMMSNSPSTPGSIDTTKIKQEPGCMSDLFDSKCKRKISFSQLGLPPRGHPPATVARRNARERNRVKQVNNGFQALKQHIPLGHRSKKMSKVETLRCAVEYIKNLQGLLDAEGNLIQTGSSQNNNSSAHHRNNMGEAGGVYENRQQHFSNNGHHQLAQKLDMANNGYNNQSHNHNHHHHHTIPNQLSPASSEDPPSPSYPSEGSSYVVSSGSMYDCENYEPVSPEDEELLDAISWWQQS